MSAPQEQASPLVGGHAGRVNLEVRQAVALLPGGRIAVAGLDNETATTARAGCVDHRGAHGTQAGQIKRSAPSQEGTPSEPVRPGSTRWPVGVSQIPLSSHAINSCMLGSSSTSRCPRQSELSAASLVATHCASEHFAFLRDSTFQYSSIWRHKLTPLDLTEIGAPLATEKWRCNSVPLASSSLTHCSSPPGSPFACWPALGAEELRISIVVDGAVGFCVHSVRLVRRLKRSARRSRLDA